MTRGRGAARAPRVHAVVLAGGAGERFWPMSRERLPKPLLRVFGGRSLLAATLARARRVAGRDRSWLICGREHAAAMRRESGLPPRRVLVEPLRRNTAMAVAYATLRIRAEDPDAIVLVLPADHAIPDAAAFARSARSAARAARDVGGIVTFGVRPTRPETGYGYIRLGKPVGPGAPGLHHVSRFVEKPDRRKARRYVDSGRYLWNAGIFCFDAAGMLREVEQHAPRLHRALAPIRAAGGRAPRGVVEAAYRRAPAVPIDTAVVERSRNVLCLPAAFAWSDVGNWQSLAETLGGGPVVTRVIEGEAVVCDSEGNLVWGSDRPIALLGVRDLAVIDAGDAVLVANLDRSGDVREIVKELRRRGRVDLV